MKYSDSYFDKLKQAYKEKSVIYIEVWFPESGDPVSMHWAFFDKEHTGGSKNTYVWTVRWK